MSYAPAANFSHSFLVANIDRLKTRRMAVFVDFEKICPDGFVNSSHVILAPLELSLGDFH